MWEAHFNCLCGIYRASYVDASLMSCYVRGAQKLHSGIQKESKQVLQVKVPVARPDLSMGRSLVCTRACVCCHSSMQVCLHEPDCRTSFPHEGFFSTRPLLFL